MSLYGGVVNMMDNNIMVSEFKLQSCYYVHFRDNIIGKKAWTPNKTDSLAKWVECSPRFNPRSRHTKDFKNSTCTPLHNTQQYKVRIKGKMEQSRERSLRVTLSFIWWWGSHSGDVGRVVGWLVSCFVLRLINPFKVI